MEMLGNHTSLIRSINAIRWTAAPKGLEQCKFYSNMAINLMLSIEQSFKLEVFRLSVEKLSREQAQKYLIEMYKVSIEKDNAYKVLIAHKWGIGND